VRAPQSSAHQGLVGVIVAVVPLGLTLPSCSRSRIVQPDAALPECEAGAPSAPASAGVDAAPGTVAPPGPMVLLKGGRFKMGDDFFAAASPAHFVTLPSFRLDVTEVTVAQYRGCVREGACSRPAPQDVQKHASVWDAVDVDTHPIAGVTWDQARAFCGWAGKELPTEEQWEYACAGAVGRDFPWGWRVQGKDWGLPDDLDERLGQRCNLNSRKAWTSTCPVGFAPRGATPEGIQDLAGNVREWTANVSCPYDKPGCSATERAVRGGVSADSDFGPNNRCVARWDYAPSHVFWRIGFRCAQRVEEAKP
jgi:eukaryotic-like serine/threonine-protein kinase